MGLPGRHWKGKAEKSSFIASHIGLCALSGVKMSATGTSSFSSTSRQTKAKKALPRMKYSDEAEERQALKSSKRSQFGREQSQRGTL